MHLPFPNRFVSRSPTLTRPPTPASSLSTPSQRRDYYGNSRAGPRYRLHSRLERPLLNSLHPQTPLLLLFLHAALQHLLHTERQDHTTSRINSLISSSYHHHKSRLKALVRWSSRPRAQHVFELSRSNAASAGTFRSPRNVPPRPRCTAIAAPRGYRCTATG